MNEDWLAGRFEGNRGRLRAMAYRMLGSASDAEDAVQEAWIRVAGAGTDGVANLEGWFTTVAARVCLDMLRSRKSRREELAGAEADAVVAVRESTVWESTVQEGPEQEALLADSVGLALLVVLDNLAPAERVAFVLHDMFGVPFGEIAEITGRSADAARQLASRARRRVRGAGSAGSGSAVSGDASVASGEAAAGQRAVSGAAVARQRAVAEAFLAASRSGDLNALLAVLDPDVVLRADAAAMPPGAPAMLRGAATVARGARAAAARSHRSVVALVNGVPGIVYAPRGRVAVVLAFTFSEDLISGIEVIADPARLEALEMAVPG